MRTKQLGVSRGRLPGGQLGVSLGSAGAGVSQGSGEGRAAWGHPGVSLGSSRGHPGVIRGQCTAVGWGSAGNQLEQIWQISDPKALFTLQRDRELKNSAQI